MKTLEMQDNAVAESVDFLPINGTDYVELYVATASRLRTIIRLLLVSNR